MSKQFTKRALSLVLALTMIMSMFTVGIVSASSAEVDAADSAVLGTVTVYFKNNLGWNNVYMTFYSDAMNSDPNPWIGNGVSPKTGQTVQMTYDASVDAYAYKIDHLHYSKYISFCKDNQSSYDNYYQTDVVYRSDFAGTAAPFFTPDPSRSERVNECNYYYYGEWTSVPTVVEPTTAPETTTYTLKIWNKKHTKTDDYDITSGVIDPISMKAADNDYFVEKTVGETVTTILEGSYPLTEKADYKVTFDPSVPSIKFTKKQYCRIAISDDTSGHWIGNDDAQIFIYTGGAYTAMNRSIETTSGRDVWYLDIVQPEAGEEISFLRAAATAKKKTMDVNDDSTYFNKWTISFAEGTEVYKAKDSGAIEASSATLSIPDPNNAANFGYGIWVDPAGDGNVINFVKIYASDFTVADNAQFYLYLPSTADTSALTFYTGFDYLKIGDTEIAKGEPVVLNIGNATSKNISFKRHPDGGTHSATLHFRKTAGTAAMFMNTAVELYTEKATAYASNYVEYKDSVSTKGTYLFYDEEGNVVNSNTELKKIKGRGNSSWEASTVLYGKYAYNVTVTEPTQLIDGCEAATKYCLLANNVDDSMLRNTVMYGIGDAVGMPYTPNLRLVDVYDNGKYLGAYTLTEKVEYGANTLIPDAVSADEMNDSILCANKRAKSGELVEATYTAKSGTVYTYQYSAGDPTTEAAYEYDGSTVTIGEGDAAVTYTLDEDFMKSANFLLEHEIASRYKAEATWFVSGRTKQAVVPKYPEFATKKQVEWMIEEYDALETAAYAKDFAGVSAVADAESFAKVYLIQELAMNLDAGATSYYILGGGSLDKLVAAPLWDYDWSVGCYGLNKPVTTGSHEVCPAHPTSDFANVKSVKSGFDEDRDINMLNLQAQLTKTGEFWKLCQKAWTNEIKPALDEYLGDNGKILSELLPKYKASAEMNEARYGFMENAYSSSDDNAWGVVSTNHYKPGSYEFHPGNPAVYGADSASYSNAVYYLNDWLETRANYMSKNMTLYDASLIEQPTEAPTPTDYYLVGTFNDWTISDEYKLAEHESNDGKVEYKIELALQNGDEFKVLSSKNVWYPAEGGNYAITENGTYSIYFRPNYDGHENWHKKCLYAAKQTVVEPTTAPTDAPTAAPTDAPTTAPTTAPVTYKEISVGIINYLTDELGTDGFYVHYWGSAKSSGDALLTRDGLNIEYKYLDNYWEGQQQTLIMFKASIPADATGFKVYHKASNRWFGGDGDAATCSKVYIFNYGGDKAIYVPDAVPTTAPTEAPTTAPTAAPTAAPTVAPTTAPAVEYFLVGSFNDWTASDDYKLVLHESNDGAVEYKIVIDLKKDDQLKVKSSNDKWYPSSMGNYVINEDASYSIYFRPNKDGHDDWYGQYIYVAKIAPATVDEPTVAPTTAPTTAPETVTYTLRIWNKKHTKTDDYDITSGVIDPVAMKAADNDYFVEKAVGEAVTVILEGSYPLTEKADYKVTFDPSVPSIKFTKKQYCRVAISDATDGHWIGNDDAQVFIYTGGAYTAMIRSIDTMTGRNVWYLDIVQPEDGEEIVFLRAAATAKKKTMDVNDDSTYFNKWTVAFAEGTKVYKATADGVISADSEQIGLPNNTVTNFGYGIWVDPTGNADVTGFVKIYSDDFASESEEFWLYLPSNTDKTALTFYTNFNYLKIGDNEVVKGEPVVLNIGEYTTSLPASYKRYDKDNTHTTTLHFRNTSGTATMFMNTAVELYTEKATAYASNYVDYKDSVSTKGTYLFYDEEGNVVNSNTELKKIKGRGNSSWEASTVLYGKYAYNVTVTEPTQLIDGCEAATKYCLLANNVDDSMLRNTVIYGIGDAVGMPYTPNLRLVDVYDNGKYLGAYTLTEKVEYGANTLIPDAVSADEMNDSILCANKRAKSGELVEATYTAKSGTVYTYQYSAGDPTTEAAYEYDGSTVTIGEGDAAVTYTLDEDFMKSANFLLEHEIASRYKAEATWFVSGRTKQAVVPKYPEFATKKQVEWMIEEYDALETAAYAKDFAGVSAVADAESFAKVYLIQELAMNLDAGATSYYILGGGSLDKLVAAPLWDYDWSVGCYGLNKPVTTGSHEVCPAHPTSDFANVKSVKSGFDEDRDINTLNLQAQMTKTGEFWKLCQKAWTTEIKPALDEYLGDNGKILNELLDKYVASAEMNEERYGFMQHAYTSSSDDAWGVVATNHYEPGSYEFHPGTPAVTGSSTGSYYNAVYYLNDWLETRANYMSNTMTLYDASLIEQPTEGPTDAPAPTEYYLVGTFNNWTISDEYKLAEHESNDGKVEYKIEIALQNGDRFKVLSSKNVWFPDEGGDYNITADGTYSIYFRPNYDGHDDWHAKCLYATKKTVVDPTTAPTTAPTDAPTTAPTAAPTEAPTTAPVPTKTIYAAIISYIASETQLNDLYVHYWGGSTGSGDALLVQPDPIQQEYKNLGSQYWNNEVKMFIVLNTQIPEDSTGFKVCYKGDPERWFGGDGDATKYDKVYVFNYDGDKAIYANSGLVPEPTEAPTDAPTDAPTEAPTAAPTVAPTTAPAVEYFLVGSFNDWTASADYKLAAHESNDGKEEYKIVIELQKGDQLKVKSSENKWFPDNMDNYKIEEDGTYAIYFRPNKDGHDDWYGKVIYAALQAPATPDEPTTAPTDAPTDAPTEAPTEAPTAAPTVAPTTAPAVEYFLVGSFNDWTASADYKLAAHESNDGKEEYKIVIELQKGDQLKVKSSENKWFPDNMDNYKIEEDGTYAIYFRPNKDGHDDWYGKVIYAALQAPATPDEPTTAPTEAPTAAPTAAPTEAPVDGRIYFKPSTNWCVDNARFAVKVMGWKYWTEKWFDLVEIGDGIYAADLTNTASWVSLTFSRMSSNSEGYDQIWNTSKEFGFQNNALYVLNEGEWDNADGTYSEYNPDATEAPTAAPTEAPTAAPTEAPTVAPTTAPAVEYFLVGSFNDWTASADYKLAAHESNDGKEEYKIVIELQKGDQLKVKSSENKWFPDNMDNYKIEEDGTYAIYFRPNKDGHDDWYGKVIYAAIQTPATPDEPTTAPTDAPTDAPTEAPTAAPTVAPTTAPAVEYFLVGSFNDWTASADYKLAAHESNDGKEEYKIVIELQKGDQLKVKSSENKWFPDNMGNYKIEEDGTYAIYFRPNKDGHDDWYGKVIYAAIQTPATVDEPTTAPTEAPTEAPTTAPVVVMGDVNGNGYVDILDATAIQRHLVDLPAAFNEAAADVDGDGEVTILDVTAIQRYLAGYRDGHNIG